jgi:hypothetical protein
MAAETPQDPLETIQLMVADVLVQTGKALRASRKDASGASAPVNVSLQSKMPETIRRFHDALNQIDTEIVSPRRIACLS